MSPLPSLLLSTLLALAAADTDYCAICADHTMCLYPEDGPAASCGKVLDGGGVTAEEQTEILNAHNTIRRDVKSGVYAANNLPAAREMPDLSWDPELAKVAHRWANQCTDGHDKCQTVPPYSAVGQNFASKSDMGSRDWTSAVNFWFEEELKNFNQKDLTFVGTGPVVGHLTQVIWAATTKVGCGLIGIEHMYPYGGHTYQLTKRNYICNYGPAGNVVGQQIYQAA